MFKQLKGEQQHQGVEAFVQSKVLSNNNNSRKGEQVKGPQR